MGYWETRLSRDEAGRRAVTNCMYMCTDRATVIVVSPCHCMIDLVSGYVRGLACDKTSQSTVGQLTRHTSGQIIKGSKLSAVSSLLLFCVTVPPSTGGSVVST